MHGVHDNLRTRYGLEWMLVEELHWSYADLMQAPNDLVEEFTTRILAQRKWQHEKDRQDKAKAAGKTGKGKRG